MVRNRIKVMRAEVGISATALSERMPEGVDKVAMSYIEQGRVLPTREGLETMCDVFDCSPADIYEIEDIDLRSVKAKPEAPTTKSKPSTVKADKKAERLEELKDRDRHDGVAQIRVWLPVEEKAALFKAVKGLGYHSVAEWLREMYRFTVHKYISLKLQDSEQLHEAVPLTTEIKSSEVE